MLSNDALTVRHEGSPEHLVGTAAMAATRLLRLSGEAAKTLDSVIVRLCDTRANDCHDQFVIASGPSFRVGYRPCEGALFEGSVSDGLEWACRNGLVSTRELDTVMDQLDDDAPVTVLYMYALASAQDQSRDCVAQLERERDSFDKLH